MSEIHVFDPRTILDVAVRYIAEQADGHEPAFVHHLSAAWDEALRAARLDAIRECEAVCRETAREWMHALAPAGAATACADAIAALAGREP